jgi:hypothetical protein
MPRQLSGIFRCLRQTPHQGSFLSYRHKHIFLLPSKQEYSPARSTLKTHVRRHTSLSRSKA